MRAITALRDVLVEQRDYERAGAVQRELLQCQVERLGGEHPDTLATRGELAMILLQGMGTNTRGA